MIAAVTSLQVLLEQDKRAATVHKLAELVNSTVAEQSGISGMTIKGGLAAACKFDRSVVAKGIDRAFPDLLKAMETYWKTYQASVDCCFGMHLENDRQGVATQIMLIMDRQLEALELPGMDKIYKACRSALLRMLEAHVGDLGNVLEEELN